MSELAEFEAGLQAIPWFERIREPLDEAVPRLNSWDDWPGPEDEAVERLALWQQDFHDMIVGEDATTTLESIFVRVRTQVIELTKGRVPYDPAQDAWHAPTSAVWFAGWTAGLVALCLATKRELPPILATQWHWYQVGRWPGALPAGGPRDDISRSTSLRVL